MINKSKDNFNYKSLEFQLREMQSELNKLNYNTERMDSFREFVNKSKVEFDIPISRENKFADLENLEQVNFISPPMSPNNLLSPNIINEQKIYSSKNPFDNYLNA